MPNIDDYAWSYFAVGPANVSYREQVAALIFAGLANQATLPGIDNHSGLPPEVVARSAIGLANALCHELARERAEAMREAAMRDAIPPGPLLVGARQVG